MSRLELYLLGPPRVERDGQAIHIVRSKVLALLAYLAVENRRHSRDTLGALLWPELDSAHARSYLRRTLSELKSILGDGLVTADRKTIGLCPDRDVFLDAEPGLWLDVAAFRQHLAACASHGHAPVVACRECQAWLEEAVALYRDDLLAGFSLPDSLAFDEWTRYQTEDLRDQLAIALERLAETLAAQGQFEDAIAHAKHWLALDPLREGAHRCLMRLYALSDQEPAALRQYQECERTLKEELGVAPSPQTVELMERLQTLRVLVPNNLPPQPTPFIGRETELTQLDDMIADPAVRLITIVGPGGIGKTRLALAAAERQLHGVEARFPDGVYFMSLTPLSPSEEMAPAVADALEFQLGGPGESRSATQRVSAYLREKRMLLLLDNFEHLLSSPASVASYEGDVRRAEGESGGVAFVADLLHTASRVQLLVTSREHLPLREEQAFHITGLDYPTAEPSEPSSESEAVPEYASVRLLLQAARRVHSGFELAREDFASIAHICRLLEGMPLAIELAATWVDVLSLSEIAAEIQRGLDFLATDWQDVPERHRSVRAAFDATWRRLTETEQAVFAQICVFRGGFTREAARGVTGADLRTLARLVDKSLLRFNRSQERYDLHELLRQYGCEQLAADPEQEHEVRDRHSAYYCDVFGRWGDGVNRGTIGDVNLDFEADWANLQVAAEWAADHGKAKRLDLALEGLMYSVWWSGRNQASERLYRRLIDALEVPLQPNSAEGKRVLAKAVMYEGQCNRMMSRWDLVASAIQRSRALLEDPALAAFDTRYERSWLHMLLAQQALPDWETAEYHYQQALALDRELGYEGHVAFQMFNLSMVYANQGRFDQARQFGEKGLAMFSAMGIKHGILDMLAALADLAEKVGDLPETERLLCELRIQATEVGNSAYRAIAVVWLGASAIMQGKHDEAQMLLLEGRQLAYQCGAMNTHCNAVWLLGELAWNCGDVNTAERQWKEALRLAHQDHLPSFLAEAKCNLSFIACARGDFDRAESLCEESMAGFLEGGGHRDEMSAVVNLALARVAFLRGALTRSASLFKTCLRDAKRMHSWIHLISGLEGLCWTMAALERYEEAAQLLGFLAADRERTGLVLPPVDRPHHERALKAARGGLGEQAFAAAWESGAALTLEEAVDFALAV